MRSDLQIVETFARKPRVFYDVAARSWAVHSSYLVQYHGDDRDRAIRVGEMIVWVQRFGRAEAWRNMRERLKRGPIDLRHFNCAGRYVTGVDHASGPDQTVEAFRTHDGNVIEKRDSMGRTAADREAIHARHERSHHLYDAGDPP